MKYLSLVLVLCGVSGLTAAPARAFDIQGQNANLEDGVNHFSSPADPFLNPDYTKGSSLALPYIGSSDSGFVSDYGNSIPIPDPASTELFPPGTGPGKRGSPTPIAEVYGLRTHARPK